VRGSFVVKFSLSLILRGLLLADQGTELTQITAGGQESGESQFQRSLWRRPTLSREAQVPIWGLSTEIRVYPTWPKHIHLENLERVFPEVVWLSNRATPTEMVRASVLF